jgi:hypothetical protein
MNRVYILPVYGDGIEGGQIHRSDETYYPSIRIIALPPEV